MDILKEKIKGLEKFTETDDLEYMEQETVDLLEKSAEKEKYIPDILDLMEKNPLTDWGLPGALVHFVESCNIDIYEKLLKESVTRCPTVHTLFMLNRLCNSRTFSEIQEYINILINIQEDTSLPEEIRNTAEDYLEYRFGIS